MHPISTLLRLWDMAPFSRLWSLWSKQPVRQQSEKHFEGEFPPLPREIIGLILLAAVSDDSQLQRNDRQAQAHAQAVSQLLLIDRSSHERIRHALRSVKGDLKEGNPACRASRIVEIAFLDTIFAQPDPELFHDFQAALQRWWPLNNSQPIYARTCHQVRVLVTPTGRVNMPVREPVTDYTLPLKHVVRVTRVPQDNAPTQYQISTLAQNPLAGNYMCFGPSGRHYILSHGSLFATFVCHIFFSFVQTGDTIKLGTCGVSPGSDVAAAIRSEAYSQRSDAHFVFDDDLAHTVSDATVRRITHEWRSVNGYVLAWMEEGESAGPEPGVVIGSQMNEENE